MLANSEKIEIKVLNNSEISKKKALNQNKLNNGFEKKNESKKRRRRELDVSSIDININVNNSDETIRSPGSLTSSTSPYKYINENSTVSDWDDEKWKTFIKLVYKAVKKKDKKLLYNTKVIEKFGIVDGLELSLKEKLIRKYYKMGNFNKMSYKKRRISENDNINNSSNDLNKDKQKDKQNT
ncbi:uncharacterized protein ASCRUDRAFT_101357 [Ascoidea rubescens DSM 1968]|uniref:Uncharacterized protein n=1 Tax=Ascoidea rubescens DSM 1968 TaxID=1344418 RepID=A0A1D2VQY6_9ASCO|nr:hypothetical protein ASCRUDRAFT_101357 [Ascoidea rubescens DSM 1968]ODV64009.1 hypothetical protein ASCRUDRAFT_101357 [Ascoidea rubescens DSM 1968]